MKKGTIFYRFVRAVGRPICFLLYRYKFNNRDNLPETGRYILCSNHISFIDPVYIILGQKRPLRPIAKIELFKNKLISAFLKKMGAFPIERGAGDGKAINQAEEILNNDEVLLIFFEGTRSKTGELLRPKTGVALMAYQTQSPIIPVCVTPKNQFVKPFSKTIISFGDPIMPEDFGIVEGTGSEYRNLSRKIMGVISEMRERDKKELLGDKYVSPQNNETVAEKSTKEA